MMNFLKGHREPTRRMADFSAAWDGGAVTFEANGILVGTRIASNLGWRAVEALAPGDQVLTFDGGMQTIVETRRKVLWDGMGDCPRGLWPVHLATGTGDLTAAVTVMPEQAVMIESDVAEYETGDPFALVNAGVLSGFDGCGRVRPTQPIEVIELVFDEDQVIYAEGGLLLFCSADCDLLVQHESLYRMLPQATAQHVVAAMQNTPMTFAQAA